MQTISEFPHTVSRVRARTDLTAKQKDKILVRNPVKPVSMIASVSCCCPPGPAITRRIIASRFALTTPVIISSSRRQPDELQSGVHPGDRSGRTISELLDGATGAVVRPSKYLQPVRMLRFRCPWQQSCLDCFSQPVAGFVVRTSQCRAERIHLCRSVVVELSFILLAGPLNGLTLTVNILPETRLLGNKPGITSLTLNPHAT